jgi:hypothetical protein
MDCPAVVDDRARRDIAALLQENGAVRAVLVELRGPSLRAKRCIRTARASAPAPVAVRGRSRRRKALCPVPARSR